MKVVDILNELNAIQFDSNFDLQNLRNNNNNKNIWDGC